MIYFLATQQHIYTIRVFLEAAGPELSRLIKPISYRSLAGSAPPRPGRYIFSDLERLDLRQLEQAETIWQKVSKANGETPPLNHPAVSMRRYELLRTLHELGRNRFDVYRLTEARRPQRYPVFLRNEQRHDGAISSLLEDEAALNAELARCCDEGQIRDGKLIVEYCDVAEPSGEYRKYGAFRVAHRIVPRHVFRSRSWQQKEPDLRDDETRRVEQAYLETNPHESALLEIFDLAGIDYGRIDYGLVDGQIQVWEINTNPVIFNRSAHAQRQYNRDFFSDRIQAAFRALL